jgi:hypothetical protein
MHLARAPAWTATEVCRAIRAASHPLAALDDLDRLVAWC